MKKLFLILCLNLSYATEEVSLRNSISLSSLRIAHSSQTGTDINMGGLYERYLSPSFSLGFEVDVTVIGRSN